MTEDGRTSGHPGGQGADVVIVGFGAAGACAAIEAARAGADVLVLDRFTGGGATALSGGVVYAGGGTPWQRAAGVADTPQAMEDYLRGEVGDAVEPATLRRFCEGSGEMLGWLHALGVPFQGSLCPYKTSYPTDRHYLYYSGSETSGAFAAIAPPAPRGHRVKGRGTSGKVLFARLRSAVLAEGVRVLPQTAAQRLTAVGRAPAAAAEGAQAAAAEGAQSADGTQAADGVHAATAVECLTLAAAPTFVRHAHAVASRYAAKPGLYVPALRRALHRVVTWTERRYGRPLTVTARRAVVLATGGFVVNRAMLREHAPAYRAGLPLGTIGDDGSGIRMGLAAGGVAARLDRVSAWRFISPPSAFVGGVLVGRDGRRVSDESQYGAALGHTIVTEHGGQGFLLVDLDIVIAARRQLREQTVWFQRLQTGYLLRTAVRGGSLAEVAARAGLDGAGLAATVSAYNMAARAGAPDPCGKPREFVRPIEHPPYALLDLSVRPSWASPCPVLTLGGLVVDEETGRLKRPDGTLIPGLYAAGRTSVGVCSNSYVSGLSLADCVFSGRRAGRHAAAGISSARCP